MFSCKQGTSLFHFKKRRESLLQKIDISVLNSCQWKDRVLHVTAIKFTSAIKFIWLESHRFLTSYGDFYKYSSIQPISLLSHPCFSNITRHLWFTFLWFSHYLIIIKPWRYCSRSPAFYECLYLANLFAFLSYISCANFHEYLVTTGKSWQAIHIKIASQLWFASHESLMPEIMWKFGRKSRPQRKTHFLW